MKDKKEKVGIIDRILTAAFSVIATYCTVIGISLLGIGGDPAGIGFEYILGHGWLNFLVNALAIMAGISGFILGSRRMLEVWGSIWRTNKPKDGNWL